MKSRGKRGIRKVEINNFKKFVPYIILVALVIILALLFLNYKGLLGNVILGSQNANSERVNLISPSDGLRITNLSQTFSCNANSSMNNVANMTLFVYNSSGQNVALEVQKYSSIYSFNISNTVFDRLPSSFTFDSNGNFYHLDFFTLFKYSPEGIFLQSVDLSRYFDNSYGKGNAVTLTTDSSNNVYVVGVQRGVLITPLKIIKFDSNGNFLKSTIVNSLSSLSQVAYNPTGITADSFGNVYITGCSVSVPISSSCTIGSCSGCPGAQFWITKYNSNLSYGGWQNIFGAQQGCFSSIYDIHGLTADPLNNIYLVGENLLSPVSSFPVSASALFIKYNSSGQQLVCNSWDPVPNNKYSTIPSSNIVFDSRGNVYIAGQTAFSNWISKFDSSGNHSWDRLFSGSGQPVIVKDNSMNIYVSTLNGYFTKYDTLGNVIDSITYLDKIAPTLASRDYLLSALYSYSGITHSYSVLSVKIINFNLFLGGLPQVSWNFTLPYLGDYSWNCKTCDLFNNCTMSSTNHSLSTTPLCTSFSYSDWNACNSSGQQTRTIITSSPSGCSGGTPIILQSCTYVPTCNESNWNYSMTPVTCPSSGRQVKHWDKTGTCSGGISHPNSESISCTYIVPICTSFTYSNWSGCHSNGTQVRILNSSSPSGCVNGGPILSQTCTPLCTEDNWNYSLSPLKCPLSGRQVKHWDKTGTCSGGISHPNSESISCTYIPPSLVGNVNNVSTNIASLSFSINGTSNISDSETLKEFMKIEFKNNNKSLLEFNHNFSAREFDFTKVKMKINKTGKVSSIVISGLNDTKSIYIDLVGNRSVFNSICIKDAEINDFGEISRYCNGTAEIYIKSVPYVLGRYSVEYADSSNSSAIVRGLLHSGVTQQCTENWQCSDWSACSGSSQTRTCNDSNNCGSVNSIPDLTQGCTIGSSSGSSGSGGSSYGSSGNSRNNTNITKVNVTNFSTSSSNQAASNIGASATNLSGETEENRKLLNTDVVIYILSAVFVIAIIIIIIVIIYIYYKGRKSQEDKSGQVFYAAKRVFNDANNSAFSGEQV